MQKDFYAHDLFSAAQKVKSWFSVLSPLILKYVILIHLFEKEKIFVHFSYLFSFCVCVKLDNIKIVQI